MNCRIRVVFAGIRIAFSFIINQQRNFLWRQLFIGVAACTVFPKHGKRTVEELVVFWSAHQCAAACPEHVAA